ncbi:hypothetical protein G5I_11194 [Acromyrmex echinatior]|uniref:Uncharacterized protein n=1 Tax=Acromyrmex echinatior TaxID=103372 RepID=F4WYY0_ACREC|nr:hypothetical protein G5I_11194 [Acromyrmex echinatior]
MGNPLLVNTLSGPVCWTATDMSPARSYPSSDVLDSNRSSNTALPDATRLGDGMVHSILFSFPIPKRKDRLEKYSNPGIGDTVKRFYGAELCQSSRRTATRASSTFWITPANSTRDSQRNSGIQDIQSCCKEEQLLWSKSLSPSSSFLSALHHHYYRHHPTSQPLFHYPSASLDYTHLENRTSQTPPRRASSIDEPSGIYALPAISEIPSQ